MQEVSLSLRQPDLLEMVSDTELLEEFITLVSHDSELKVTVNDPSQDPPLQRAPLQDPPLQRAPQLLAILDDLRNDER